MQYDQYQIGYAATHQQAAATSFPAVSHLLYLDSLRGLCALYVVGCHAYLMYAHLLFRFQQEVLADTLLRGTVWLAFGRSAVAVFIVLSGYCLMLPVIASADRKLRGGLSGFMRRRCRRIIPPYYGALLVSLLLIAIVPDLRDPNIGQWNKSFPAFTPGAILSHLFLIHNYHPAWQYAIDHPMWSIATEWQLYFLFPVLVWVWRHHGTVRLLLVAMIITTALLMSLMVFGATHNPWPPQFVGLFAFGMAAATVADPRGNGRATAPRVQWGRWAAILFGVCVLIHATLTKWIIASGREQIPDFLIGAAVACLMIFCTHAIHARTRPTILRWLETRPLVHLGHFSYSLYLIHAPVLALVYLAAQHLELGDAALQLFVLLLGIPTAVCAGYGFYLVFERPFMTRRRG